MAQFKSFKGYLKKEGQNMEVRRFGIDMGAATNYMYLQSKIQAVFPSIQHDQFDILWRDCENDFVTISSDEELRIALSAVNDQPVKIFIQAKAKEKPAPGTQSAQVHHGVVCDSCNNVIFGSRYKCVTCPDFDLCAQCEAIGKHSEHLMLRISTPHGPGAASCPKLVPTLFGRPNKLHKRDSLGHGHGESGVGLGRPHSSPYTQNQGPRAAADMLDFSTLRNVFNGLGLHIPEDQPTSQAQAASSTQAAPPTAQASSSAQASPVNTAGEPPQGTEYLTGIGQAIASFLDPFNMPEEKKQKMMKNMLFKSKANPSKKYAFKSLLKLHQVPQNQNLEAFHGAVYLDSYQDPRGHTRYVNVPYGQGPLGSEPYSHGPPGNGPRGHGPLAIGPHGHGPHGNGPHGHGPLGNEPHGHGPLGNGPPSHGPLGNGPHSHGPLGNGPHGHGPPGNGPYSHGPLGNGPHSHGPHGNGPIGLRPGVSLGHMRRRAQKLRLLKRHGRLGNGPHGYSLNVKTPHGHGPHEKGPYGHENGLHRGCLLKKGVVFRGHGEGHHGHVTHEHGFLGTFINPVIIDDEPLQVVNLTTVQEIRCEDNTGVDLTFDVRSKQAEANSAPTTMAAPAPATTPTSTPAGATSPTSTVTPVTADILMPTPAAAPVDTILAPTQSGVSTASPVRRNSDDWTLLNQCEESPTRSMEVIDVESSDARPKTVYPVLPKDMASAATSPSSAPSVPMNTTLTDIEPRSMEVIDVESSDARPKTVYPVLPKDMASAATSPNSAPSVPMNTTLTDIERQRIQEAVDKIRSMGFNFDNSLLVDLLKNENCDIASVIELILSSGK